MKVQTSSASSLARRASLLGAALGVAALTAGCGNSDSGMKALRPVSSETLALFEQKGVRQNSPTLLRSFKKEAELEVWKQRADGEFVHIKTYPMCRWSGQLGPKKREGDRQVPEGFYTITQRQMNPNSSYYLSFDIGYPNAYDQQFGRTGGNIMVHGACSSSGCFSMTDEQIAELYAIARESFNGGQRGIQIQSMPFRMNAENLAKFRLDPNMPFWRDLKRGTDMFDVTKREPRWGVCNGKYGFNTDGEACQPTPADVAREVAAKQQRDDHAVAELVDKVRPVRLQYADGGQHPSFRHVQMVSRPDALAAGPVEIELEDRARKPAIVAAAAKPAAPAAAPALAAASAAASAEAPVAATPATVAAIPAPRRVTTIARAEPAVPAAPAAAPATAQQVETQAFYKRWLSFGGDSAAPPAAQAVEGAADAGAEPTKPVAISPSAVRAAPRAAAPKPQAALY